MRLKFCLLLLLVALFIAPARAQLPPGLPLAPENFATPHFWGSPSAISIQHFALGGAFVADDRNGWHGNPAGMIAVQEPTLLASYNRSSFESLPTFDTAFVGYAQPLGKRGLDVLKISAITVRAQGDVNGGPVPIALDAKEDDIGIEYARRLSDKLTLGIGTAYLRTDSTYSIAGVGDVTRLRSRPATLGGRIGAIYDFNAQFSIGATYDDYRERVERSVPALPLPAESFRFHSTAYRVGAAYRPDAQTMLLADYEELRLKGNDTTISQYALLLGAERKVGAFALRIGSYDGKLTGGVGVGRGRLRLDYGFSGRYDKNLPGQGARAAHALQIRAEF